MDDDDGHEAAMDAVASMVTVVNQYAAAWQLEVNTTKSRRFSTSAPVRRSLGLIPGWEVAKAFKDLGVIQRTTDTADAAAARVRDDEALRRLHKVEVITAPLHVRAQIAAASPGGVGSYGLAAQPISAARLKTMRDATFRAIWRSPGYAAQEIVYEVLVPWRCDPGFLACAKPLMALRSGLLRGAIPGDRIGAIWNTPHHAGPMRAVQDACRRLGVTVDPIHWTLVGHTTLPLLTTPKAQLEAFIGQALHAMGRRALIKRRPHLAAIGPTLDLAAITASLRAIDLESQRAAMRVILADGVITQARASHWVPGGKSCPHCQLADEDVYHRLWTCPAWDRHRRDPMREWTLSSLQEVLPPCTFLTGLLPECPVLLAARDAAEASIALPPPVHITGKAHTDGSCLHPTDPLLSRAAWAVAGPGLAGLCTLAQQRVAGKQTIGRAELSALVWLTHCTGDFSVSTDCLYLQRRFTLLNSGPMPHAWTEGVNGDLWKLVRRTDLVVTWIHSHIPEEEVALSGFTWEDWRGNRAADIAAGLLAATLVLSPDIVSRRERTLAALQVAYQVMSKVEEAVLTVHHAPDHPIAKRRKRVKRFRVFRPKRRAPTRPRPPGPAPPGDSCGTHALVIGAGPAPANAAPSGNVSWPLSCHRCSRSVTGTSRWRAFAIGRCLADPQAAFIVRNFTHHDLQRCIGGWFCSRCHLAVSSSRRAAASRANCPVPQIFNGAGQLLPLAMAGLCHNLRSIAAWRVGWSSSAPAMPAASVPVAVAPAALSFATALAWRPHWELAAQWSGNVTCVCLRCGLWGTKRLPRRIAACACSLTAVAVLRGAAKAALLAGAFDAALSRSTVAIRDRAVFLGWTPVALGTGAA